MKHKFNVILLCVLVIEWTVAASFYLILFSSDLASIHLLESMARTWNRTLDWIILALWISITRFLSWSFFVVTVAVGLSLFYLVPWLIQFANMLQGF